VDSEKLPIFPFDERRTGWSIQVEHEHEHADKPEAKLLDWLRLIRTEDREEMRMASSDTRTFMRADPAMPV
jgi:hypothetical protein